MCGGDFKSRETKVLLLTKAQNQNFSWDTPISVSFEPKFVIVRSITFGDNATNKSYAIRSNIVSGDGLGVAFDYHSAMTPMSLIPIQGRIVGTYNISLYDSTGGVATAAAANAYLSLVLEFVA